jgi:hypothetical protein
MECPHRIINIVCTLLQCIGCFMIKSQKSKLCIETEAIETNDKNFIVKSFGSKCEICFDVNILSCTLQLSALFPCFLSQRVRLFHCVPKHCKQCSYSVLFWWSKLHMEREWWCLTFMEPCITRCVLYITNKLQLIQCSLLLSALYEV